jgi:hypothetical protein
VVHRALLLTPAGSGVLGIAERCSSCLEAALSTTTQPAAIALLLVVQPSTPRDVPPRLAERDGPGAEVDRHLSLGVDDSAGAGAPKPPATFAPIPR